MVCAIFIPVLHQRCFKVSPLITIALCFARLLEAALPALQVFVVGYLIAGRSGSSLTLWELIFLVVVTGGIMPLSAMVDALNLRLQFTLRYAYTYEVIDIYASLTPAQRRDSSMIDEVQAAHDSIPFNLSWQASSALNIIGAFTTAILLFSSLANLDLLAAAILGVVSAMLATKSAGSAYGELMASAPIVLRYLKLRNTLNSIAEGERDNQDASAPQSETTLLKCEQVDFVYSEQDANVLNELSLEVEAGKIVAVVGANGAGKSTAIKVLTGQLKPKAGELYTRLAGSEVAVMPRDIEKFELTVREFLSLPYYRSRTLNDDDLWEALEKVDLAEHVKGLPGGLDTQLGEQWDGTDLSGGQWQRLALARTLLSDAKLLVLDEPTSSVDAESESKLFHMLKSETPKRSVLLVSHRAWTLRYADKIYLLDHGTLVQSGAFETLKNQEGPFRHLFESQDWNQS